MCIICTVGLLLCMDPLETNTVLVIKYYIYMIFGMSNSTINLSILLMNDDILWPAEHRRMWLSFFYSSSSSNETLFLSYFKEIKMQEIHQKNFLHEFYLD